MRTSTWLRAGGCLALAVAATTLAGCGGPDRARVKGHVKFYDKDLTAGTVSFISKDGIRVGTANIDFSGNYDVSDAPVGEVVITVRVPSPPKGPAASKEGGVKAPAGLPEMRNPVGGGESTSYTPTIDFSKIVQIPGKYGSVETSGMTFTVSRGEQTKDIVLSP